MSRNKNEKKKFASRKFKMGSFQTITMVIVLAVVVLVNVVIARMNWSKDMNSDYLYSLSSDTISYVKGLKDDITFIIWWKMDMRHRRVLIQRRLMSRISLNFTMVWER